MVAEVAAPGTRPDRPDRHARFDARVVVDWNDVAIGELAEAERDPRTMDLRTLTVRLNEDAQRRAGVAGPDLVIPAAMVAGIRRDAFELDRPVEALGRVGRCAV